MKASQVKKNSSTLDLISSTKDVNKITPNQHYSDWKYNQPPSYIQQLSNTKPLHKQPVSYSSSYKTTTKPFYSTQETFKMPTPQALISHDLPKVQPSTHILLDTKNKSWYKPPENKQTHYLSTSKPSTSNMHYYHSSSNVPYHYSTLPSSLLPPTKKPGLTKKRVSSTQMFLQKYGNPFGYSKPKGEASNKSGDNTLSTSTTSTGQYVVISSLAILGAFLAYILVGPTFGFSGRRGLSVSLQDMVEDARVGLDLLQEGLDEFEWQKESRVEGNQRSSSSDVSFSDNAVVTKTKSIKEAIMDFSHQMVYFFKRNNITSKINTHILPKEDIMNLINYWKKQLSFEFFDVQYLLDQFKQGGSGTNKPNKESYEEVSKRKLGEILDKEENKEDMKNPNHSTVFGKSGTLYFLDDKNTDHDAKLELPDDVDPIFNNVLNQLTTKIPPSPPSSTPSSTSSASLSPTLSLSSLSSSTAAVKTTHNFSTEETTTHRDVSSGKETAGVVEATKVNGTLQSVRKMIINNKVREVMPDDSLQALADRWRGKQHRLRMPISKGVIINNRVHVPVKKGNQ